MLPGAEEVLALLEVRDQARSGRWDLVVVDCAPTAETLRLLALPEALGWYMDRVLPMERRMVKVLKPVLTRAAGVPMPHDSVFDAIERLHADLAEVRDLLTGPEASVRLVLTPESVVVAEARRSLTTLSLYGYRVDGVVANRIFPDDRRRRLAAAWVARRPRSCRGRGVVRAARRSGDRRTAPASRSDSSELGGVRGDVVRRRRPVRGAARCRTRSTYDGRGSMVRAARGPAVRGPWRRRPGPPR